MCVACSRRQHTRTHTNPPAPTPPTAVVIADPRLNLVMCAQPYYLLRWRADMGGHIPKDVLPEVKDLEPLGASTKDGFGAR